MSNVVVESACAELLRDIQHFQNRIKVKVMSIWKSDLSLSETDLCCWLLFPKLSSYHKQSAVIANSRPLSHKGTKIRSYRVLPIKTIQWLFALTFCLLVRCWNPLEGLSTRYARCLGTILNSNMLLVTEKHVVVFWKPVLQTVKSASARLSHNALRMQCKTRWQSYWQLERKQDCNDDQNHDAIKL